MATNKKTQTKVPPVKKVEIAQTAAPVLQPEKDTTSGDDIFGGAPAPVDTPAAQTPVVDPTPADIPAVTTPANPADPTKVVIPKAEVFEEEAGSENDDDIFGEVNEGQDIDPETVPEIDGVEDVIGGSGKGGLVVGDPHAKEDPKGKKGMVTRANMHKNKMTEAEQKELQEEIDSTLSIQLEIAKSKSKKVPLNHKPKILDGVCEFCGRIHASTEGAVIVRHLLKIELKKEQVPILHAPTCYWAKLQFKMQS